VWNNVPKVLYEAIVTIVDEVDIFKRLAKNINEDNKRSFADIRSKVEQNDLNITAQVEKTHAFAEDKFERLMDRSNKMKIEEHASQHKINKRITEHQDKTDRLTSEASHARGEHKKLTQALGMVKDLVESNVKQLTE
jgi:hypothetical protein